MTTFRTSLNSTSLVPPAYIQTHNSNHAVLPAPFLSKVKGYPIQLLDALVTRHFRATQYAPLSLSGTYLPLIYKLVATLITSPQNKAVIVIDTDAKFDITRVLQCAPHPPATAPATEQTAPGPASPGPVTTGDASVQQQLQRLTVSNLDPQQDSTSATLRGGVAVEDLRHIHVYRPARGFPSHIRDVLASAEHFMIYSRHASVAREWWGTVVIGGGSPTTLGSGLADVTTGWKGWLRVDRDEVRGFPLGMSAKEALVDRDQRQRAVDASGYVAACAWGSFNFKETDGE